MTVALITISNFVVHYWYLLPGIPLAIWLAIKLIRKFYAGRMGWDMFMLKMPIFGPLGREEHRRPHHAHPRHPGGQRRAHPRSPAHHQGDLGQRRLREPLPEGLRVDPRGRVDRQADEGELPDRRSIPWPCSSGPSGRR